MSTIYSTPKKFMYSFDDIVSAMAEKHNVNPYWGVARPGVMSSHGTKTYSHEFEFLIGNQVARFDLSEVESTVADYFDLNIVEEPELHIMTAAKAKSVSAKISALTAKKKK